MTRSNRKLTGLLIDFIHACARVRILAREEAKVRRRKQRAFKEMYRLVDELVLHDKMSVRKDDKNNSQ